MSGFIRYTAETAPAAARADLDKLVAIFGIVPNAQAYMAESPELLAGYSALAGLASRTTLTPTERQIIFMTANFEDACSYSMAGHTTMAKREGIHTDVIAALRAGQPLSDLRLEALHRFATIVVRERGFATEVEFDAFLAAGYTRRNALEVVLAIAMKTITNLTSHLVGIELDPFMAGNEWVKPAA
jgi:alkylhydroperoxidase family enzyme